MENTKLQENMKREELYASIGLNAVKAYLKEEVGLSDKDVDFLISLDVNNNLEETLDNLTFEQAKQLDGLVINYPTTSSFIFKDVINLMSVCLGCTGIRFVLQQEYTLDKSREIGDVFLMLDELVKIDGEYEFYHSCLDDQIFCPHELERNLKNFSDAKDEKFLSKYFKESLSLIMKNHKSYRFFDNMKWYTLDLEEFNNTGGFEGIKERAIQEYLERETNNSNGNIFIEMKESNVRKEFIEDNSKGTDNNAIKLSIDLQKAFVKRSLNISDAVVKYLINLNPGKNLEYTLDNITLEQARKLPVYFVNIVSDKSFITDELIALMDVSFSQDNCNKDYKGEVLATLTLGNALVKLQPAIIDGKFYSNYILYTFVDKEWKYLKDIPTSDIAKLYKDLMQYVKTSDESYIVRYIEEMFEIITNQDNCKWYAINADASKGFDSIDYVDTSKLKEISKMEKPDFFSLDSIVKALILDGREDRYLDCRNIMHVDCGNYRIELQVECYEGKSTAEYAIYVQDISNKTFDATVTCKDTENADWIHVSNTEIFEDLSDLYENMLTYLELGNPMFTFIDYWHNKMLNILGKYLLDNNLM